MGCRRRRAVQWGAKKKKKHTARHRLRVGAAVEEKYGNRQKDKNALYSVVWCAGAITESQSAVGTSNHAGLEKARAMNDDHALGESHE